MVLILTIMIIIITTKFCQVPIYTLLESVNYLRTGIRTPNPWIEGQANDLLYHDTSNTVISIKQNQAIPIGRPHELMCPYKLTQFVRMDLDLRSGVRLLN